MRAPFLVCLYLSSYPILCAIEFVIHQRSPLSSLLRAAVLLATFTVAIFTSIATYRLFFHRLGRFPGPILARASKLWHMYQCLDGQNHLVLDGLRDRYGDFVRTGPNEITIFDPEVLWKLDGPGAKTTKSVWYDFLLPDMGVTTIRDKPFHDKRRRVWTKAFSNSALENYESQMVEHAAKLDALISAAATNGDVVNFSQLAYWFSFDVMGLFALSQSFDMLHSERWHYAVSNLRNAMQLLGPLSPVPWLAQIGFYFLRGWWKVRDWHIMTGWCKSQMDNRIRIDDDAQNIAHYLIADSKNRGALEQDHHLLAGESIVAIVAGSDTVAPTLVFMFYELALHPEQADKLHEELQRAESLDSEILKTLPHLNAVINETLRLHPAVPTGGYRDTPSEGMQIGDQWIPGSTTIVAPRYTISRLESCYEQANRFIPERWYSRPELVKDGRSFLPFAQGRYTCLGKTLALAELRKVTALLVAKYHVRFVKGEDRSIVERDMRDQFTAAPGQLRLVFERREAVASS